MEILKPRTFLNNEEIERIMYHDADATYDSFLDLSSIRVINASEGYLKQFNDFLWTKGVSRIRSYNEEGLWAFCLFDVDADQVTCRDMVALFKDNEYKYNIDGDIFNRYANAILKRGNTKELVIGQLTDYALKPDLWNFINMFRRITFGYFNCFLKFWQFMDNKQLRNLRRLDLNLVNDYMFLRAELAVSDYSYPCLTMIKTDFEFCPNHVDNGVIYEERGEYLYWLLEANRTRLKSAVALHLSMSKMGFAKDLCRMFSRALVFWTNRNDWKHFKMSSKPNAIVFKNDDRRFMKLLDEQKKTLKTQKDYENNLNSIELSRKRTQKLQEKTETKKNKFESQQKKFKSMLNKL